MLFLKFYLKQYETSHITARLPFYLSKRYIFVFSVKSYLLHKSRSSIHVTVRMPNTPWSCALHSLWQPSHQCSFPYFPKWLFFKSPASSNPLHSYLMNLLPISLRIQKNQKRISIYSHFKTNPPTILVLLSSTFTLASSDELFMLPPPASPYPCRLGPIPPA